MSKPDYRRVAFKTLGYSEDQTVAGMLAKDLPKLLAIESSLFSAHQKGLEEGLDRAAECTTGITVYSSEATNLCTTITNKILALKREGKV